MQTEAIKNETEIIREIESGKYRDFYLVVTRKSTDDLDNQKNSTKYQKAENLRYAVKERLSIAPLTLEGFCRDGVITEHHSAFKEDVEMTFRNGKVEYKIERPKFYQLVQWLSKGYFKGAIFYSWDRASRNKADDAILRKLMKAGVDIRFVVAKYDKSSSGELHMDVDGMFAAHHSRVTSEKVSMTIRNSRARGIWTNKAPVGYLNKGSMLEKPFDPERAPIIHKLFELYSTGDWSLSDLARWATEQGFTMPPMRRRRTVDEVLAEEEDDVRLQIEATSRLPTYNSIHKVLTNRFYTGKLFTKDGEWIQSNSHNALVSEDLFNEVQMRLHKRNRSAHYSKLLERPFRGLIRCVCGRVFTPYPQKGILYLGARCKANCENENNHFNFDFIDKKIGELISRLSFTDEELEQLDTRTGTEIAILESKRLGQLEDINRKKKQTREELAYLNANRLTLLKTGTYTPEEIVAEDARLKFELEKLSQYERASDVAMAETVKSVMRLSELLKNLYSIYQIANPHQKEEIIREIFSELVVNGDTLEYQCKKGLQPLASRFVANCDPTGNRTPLSTVRGSRPSR